MENSGQDENPESLSFPRRGEFKKYLLLTLFLLFAGGLIAGYRLREARAFREETGLLCATRRLELFSILQTRFPGEVGTLRAEQPIEELVFLRGDSAGPKRRCPASGSFFLSATGLRCERHGSD